MSRRIFATIRRGPMDNTPVCVFPWELALLSHVHGQEVKEVSIEAMTDLGDGVVKIERAQLKKNPRLRSKYAPDLLDQLQIMAYVEPETDPVNDPTAEYSRLIEKYGMDKEMPVPVVERVYGQLTSFELVVKEQGKQSLPRPKILDAVDAGISKPIDQMSMSDLRAELDSREISWNREMKAGDLRKLLEEAVATA